MLEPVERPEWRDRAGLNGYGPAEASYMMSDLRTGCRPCGEIGLSTGTGALEVPRGGRLRGARWCKMSSDRPTGAIT